MTSKSIAQPHRDRKKYPLCVRNDFPDRFLQFASRGIRRRAFACAICVIFTSLPVDVSSGPPHSLSMGESSTNSHLIRTTVLSTWDAEMVLLLRLAIDKGVSKAIGLNAIEEEVSPLRHSSLDVRRGLSDSPIPDGRCLQQPLATGSRDKMPVESS